ncbi:2-amino-4-hydroxy-6-hydroxymethyldihydropteridine diphosphokinase [Rhodoferax sp. TS-BS-61-7]|uniref:2-amino-4-hydroxy-6- hydroxymethyldihydropteridine diphosphokinase n=1 Tax=Rhodoferax sp. TS-BS-61-7 TaxID=2094194 RepID=UPI000CF6DF43|nr:2-amino-4-hydroxy-6-hydroxymethyldihydropteridine diphosphokinase [Rhodoferax sp. TS-BS-61-7]PQA77371.1 2-amino-4-hydroxy-6-hydroxymethyldihydropteridine diphosphokinase [Rhodoferax sp. TS-BS-61-7]
MRAPVLAYIGLGANLGEPVAALQAALAALATVPQCTLRRQSALYGSAPIDSSGPDYVNAVAELSTTLSAPALLQALQQIELDAGRERPYRNAPRTLDLDVLLYGSATIHSATLIVPHPRMRERAFVLLPLAELLPDQVSPLDLAAVQDQGVWRMAG